MNDKNEHEHTRDQKETLSPLRNTLMRFHSFPYQHTNLSHPFSLALFPSHVHTHTHTHTHTHSLTHSQEREEEVQSLPLDEDGEGCFDLSLTNLKMFSLNLQGAERQTPICCSAVPFTPALITCLAALETDWACSTPSTWTCHKQGMQLAEGHVNRGISTLDRTHYYRRSIKTVNNKNNNC